jgi:hypothetical protein
VNELPEIAGSRDARPKRGLLGLSRGQARALVGLPVLVFGFLVTGLTMLAGFFLLEGSPPAILALVVIALFAWNVFQWAFVDRIVDGKPK